MSYNYQIEKQRIFTEEGQKDFLAFRDRANELIKKAGAFRLIEAFGSGDTFFQTACVDRMVELGELVEFVRPCWGQYRVFTTPQVHNL